MEQFFNSPYGISMRRDKLLGKPGNHDILMEIFEEGISQQILKEFPVVVLFARHAALFLPLHEGAPRPA